MLFNFLDPIDKKEMGLHDNCEPVHWMGCVPVGNNHWAGWLMAKQTWGLVFLPLTAILTVVYWQ